jgi:hypothetical protein
MLISKMEEEKENITFKKMISLVNYEYRRIFKR